MAEHDKTSTTDTNEGPSAGADGTGAPAAEAPPATGERIEKLERDVAEMKDRWIRAVADFENYKKRARREQEEAASRGRESLLKELLGVLDNLDRAIVAATGGTGSIQALADGVKLVDKQFHGVLEKFDVRRFDAQGQPFDPARHEAIQQVETADLPSGTVAQVFARGYTMGERLLRPAIVAVAKAPAGAAPASGERPGGDGGESIH